jgi:hypothetical protein
MVFASILILFLSVKSSLLRVPAHRKITILANLRTEDPTLSENTIVINNKEI